VVSVAEARGQDRYGQKVNYAGQKLDLVVVAPYAGLCNRMRVMARVVAAGRKIGSFPQFSWLSHRACPCEFEDLFVPDGREVVTQSGIPPGFVAYQMERRRVGAKVKAEIYFVSEGVLVMTGRSSRFSPAGGHDVSVEDIEQAFDIFRPTKEISAEVDSFMAGRRFSTGLHIRRTDHKPARENSPDSVFEEAASRADGLVFLATDNPDTQRKFKAKFGGKILFYSEMVGGLMRNTTMQSALVDLLLLSRCDVIIGSYRSSFSHSAQILSRLRKHKVVSEVSEG